MEKTFSIKKKPSPAFFQFITGPMFAGKTEKIIKIINYHSRQNGNQNKHNDNNFLVFKPKIDHRFKNDLHHIVSHNKKRFCKAWSVTKPTEIWEIIKQKKVKTKIALIFISEIHLFSEDFSFILEQISAAKISLVCEGLTFDFRKKTFPTIEKILTLRPKITKLFATCFYCFKKATFSQRITKDKALILVGADDIYRPVCDQCYDK